MFPIDEPEGFSILANIHLQLHSIAEHLVGIFVDVVETPALVSGDLIEFVERFADLVFCVFRLLLEKCAQESFLDIPIIRTVVPIAKVGVGEPL